VARDGLIFDLSENLELRGDYSWFSFDDVGANLATITGILKFWTTSRPK
jgi:hypothetical protein